MFFVLARQTDTTTYRIFRPYYPQEALQGYTKAAAVHGWKVGLFSVLHNASNGGVYSGRKSEGIGEACHIVKP
jgi:hypothetical protein